MGNKNNSSVYSDSVLAKFFNPKNPSNKGLPSFKIPKLKQRDKKKDDAESTAQSSKEKRLKTSQSITNQNVLVDGKWVTLGTYLDGVGISPGMDATKLTMRDGEARTDDVGKVRKAYTMDKKELDDIHNNNWD